ncbi:uridine kinase [Mesoterricola silvestris]|uniref:uridine/cytidine kinase n=1 Tax=Mesoterricola silvestris TaxID=2927979 RepID=A0AA48GZ52_9BACT|nr:uridine kinase [Mesoterricola silvestris]BDU73033.1 uridine kinase [Mesoterricola silvestris]
MTNKTLLFGIVGGSGSGKTSIANALLRRMGEEGVNALLLDMDAYYAPLEVVKARFHGRPINWDHPHAFDLELMASHLKALAQGQPIRKPIYDFKTSDRLGWEEPLNPGQVVVLEGLLLFALPELRDQMDVKIFVDTDADIRILRRIQRDTAERGRSIESVIDQYLNSVRPMHLEFVEPSKRWADLIVPVGVENTTALDMLLHHVLGRLGEQG